MDPAASIFLRLRALHPLIAVLAGCWICFYMVGCANGRGDARRQAWWTLGLLGARFFKSSGRHAAGGYDARA